MEEPRYYPCRVRINGEVRIVAWYAAEHDGFLRAPDGRLVVADAVTALGVKLDTAEPVEYDFDCIRVWCAAPDATGVNCRLFLDAWNFLDDLAGLHAGIDTQHTRLSRAAEGVYDKLFWGNNLPAVTPAGEKFDPSWSPDELATIRGVFESGLSILVTELTGGP